jgi:hypothetical protein
LVDIIAAATLFVDPCRMGHCKAVQRMRRHVRDSGEINAVAGTLNEEVEVGVRFG